MAVRIARAATGRDLVAKARCGYHGSWDGLWVSAEEDGPELSGLVEPGVPRAVHDLVRVFDFNDPGDLTRVCEAAGSDLAAVIIEPLLGSGGCVPGTPEFFALARELADRTGAVLILDEVQTFRLATGGYQQKLECLPDLTTLGKLIGGGFPDRRRRRLEGAPRAVPDRFAPPPRALRHLQRESRLDGGRPPGR